MEIKRKTEEFLAIIRSYQCNENVSAGEYEKLNTLFNDPSFRLYAQKTHQAIAVYNFLENRYTYISEAVKLYCPGFDLENPEAGPDLFIGMMKPSSIEAMISIITPKMLTTSQDYKSQVTALRFSACIEINPVSDIQWILLQTYLLSATAEGFPLLSCTMITDVTSIKKDVLIHYSAHLIEKGNSRLLYSETMGSSGEGISLSKREIEVLELVSKGNTTKEISDILFVSFETVKKHRSNIMKKMNCTNTTELLNQAMVMGIV